MANLQKINFEESLEINQSYQASFELEIYKNINLGTAWAVSTDSSGSSLVDEITALIRVNYNVPLLSQSKVGELGSIMTSAVL